MNESESKILGVQEIVNGDGTKAMITVPWKQDETQWTNGRGKNASKYLGWDKRAVKVYLSLVDEVVEDRKNAATVRSFNTEFLSYAVKQLSATGLKKFNQSRNAYETKTGNTDTLQKASDEDREMMMALTGRRKHQKSNNGTAVQVSTAVHEPGDLPVETAEERLSQAPRTSLSAEEMAAVSQRGSV